MFFSFKKNGKQKQKNAPREKGELFLSLKKKKKNKKKRKKKKKAKSKPVCVCVFRKMPKRENKKGNVRAELTRHQKTFIEKIEISGRNTIAALARSEARGSVLARVTGTAKQCHWRSILFFIPPLSKRTWKRGRRKKRKGRKGRPG